MNYTWKVTKLTAFPTLDGKSNVISKVSFDVSAEENGTRITHSGSVNLPTENIEVFIPFDQLSEEMLLLWVKHYLGQTGVDAIEFDVANELRLQFNRPSMAVPVSNPW